MSFLLWPSCFILSGAISNCPPLFPSNILDIFWPVGGSSSSILSFSLFILSMGFPRQEYWSGLPFSSPATLLPRWLRAKESTCKCRSHGFGPWVRKPSWEGNGNSSQYLPEKSMDRGAWWATVHGVPKELRKLCDRHICCHILMIFQGYMGSKCIKLYTLNRDSFSTTIKLIKMNEEKCYLP